MKVSHMDNIKDERPEEKVIHLEIGGADTNTTGSKVEVAKVLSPIVGVVGA